LIWRNHRREESRFGHSPLHRRRWLRQMSLRAAISSIPGPDRDGQEVACPREDPQPWVEAAPAKRLRLTAMRSTQVAKTHPAAGSATAAHLGYSAAEYFPAEYRPAVFQTYIRCTQAQTPAPAQQEVQTCDRNSLHELLEGEVRTSAADTSG